MTATTVTATERRARRRPPTGTTRPDRLGRWWSDTLVFAGRNLQHIRQIPEKLLDVTVQPLMFVLLFAYVFGGAIAVSGGSYREYLIGGILVQSLAFGLIGPGHVDRHRPHRGGHRPLPVAARQPRSAYLSGHYLAELAGMGLAIVILLGAGLLVGWRTHAPWPTSPLPSCCWAVRLGDDLDRHARSGSWSARPTRSWASPSRWSSR